MTTTTFCLTNLTDFDLSCLMTECQSEQKRREERRAKEREEWVTGYYYAFLNHPNATAIEVDGVTVVAVYSRNTGMHMGTARPVHGDTYNKMVGLAVAYAKAFGTPIPDFI